jgi:rhodanese-related sulfurtransferase
MEFISNINNLILLALMLVSGALLLVPNLQSLIQGKFGVSPAIATQLINRKRANIIDIRPQEDFQTGHIARSRHLNVDDLISNLAMLRLDKSVPLIVVCETGQKSASYVPRLQKDGYSDVVCLEGGIKAWNTAGLPLVNK